MRPIIKEVIKLAVFVLFILTAFTCFQNMITEIHEKNDQYTFGPFRLAVHYTFFLMMTFFTPFVKRSLKWQMSLGVLGHSLNYSTGIYLEYFDETTKYIIIGIGAVASGIGDAFIFTVFGRYLHNLCEEYEEIENKGKIFGICYMIAISSTITSGLPILFGSSSSQVFFILLTGIGIGSALFGIFALKDVKDYSEENVQTIKQSLKNVFSYYPKAFPIVAFAIIDGISMGFAASTIIHLIPQDQREKKNQLEIFAYFLFIAGVGTISGGFLGGKVCDIYPLKKGGIMVLVWYVLACLVCYLTFFVQVIELAFFSRFCWGFQIAFQQSYVMVCCSKMYDGSKQSFAIVKQIHSLSFIIYEVISLLTHNQISVLYIVPAIILFILPCIFGLMTYPKEKSKKESLLQSQASQ